MNTEPRLPVCDLHCDLLAYLTMVDGADPDASEEIGCAIPRLREGNVAWQILAIYTATGKGSTAQALQQAERYRELVGERTDALTRVGSSAELNAVLAAGSGRVGVTAAVENASGLCEEDEPLERAFERLAQITETTGRLLYISLTHHDENRFGGGNRSTVGLKDDGKALLEHLHGKQIAIDISHSSDALASGIFEEIDRRRLDLRVIASHSNFRSVRTQPRNLPDELAQEIIRRGGLIGMVFVRSYLHPADPTSLMRHIHHGLEVGARDALCLGADFFHTGSVPDESRLPFFFEEHSHAGKYPAILQSLNLDRETQEALAHGNVSRFVQELWRD